tara:strand:+ start:1317 stop:2018 length:702 start_codon:yes stop_codon:yes gene_type:complete
MRKYFIIPARGGSKGIKNKNQRTVSKYSLVEWSIIHSLFLSSKKDHIIVSSDNQNILNIAKKYNIDAQKRPDNLSGDKVFTEPVMSHALSRYDIKDDDIVILIQPTSPLRKKQTLISALNAVEHENFDSSLTVKEVHQFKWTTEGNHIGNPVYQERPRRQDMSPEFIENGSVYMTKYNNFLKSNNRISGKTKLIISDQDESIDVDNLTDLKITRILSKPFVKEWEEFIKNIQT